MRSRFKHRSLFSCILLTFCPPLHWKWEIIWTNRFTVSAVVLPFVSWETRKSQVLERSLFNGYINTCYKHVLFHSVFLLIHSLSFSHSCSCLLTGTSSALQNATWINTICTPEKRLVILISSEPEQCDTRNKQLYLKVCSHHLGINMRHFHTWNTLNCTEIAFSRCHICHSRTRQFSFFFTYYQFWG